MTDRAKPFAAKRSLEITRAGEWSISTRAKALPSSSRMETRPIGYIECEITDEGGRLVAKASSTCMALKGERARGR